MSADLTAAHEALREILAGLDASVTRLREIADGLRDKPEPELPPEPEDGTRWLDAAGNVWSRRDGRSNDLHRWVCDARPGRYNWDGVLLGARLPLVQLVRADQTVVLPDPPQGEVWAGKVKAQFLEPPDGPRRRLRLTVWDGLDPLPRWHDLDPAVAERWALEVLALVRSKGGAL
jgi:hypothetical protein